MKYLSDTFNVDDLSHDIILDILGYIKTCYSFISPVSFYFFESGYQKIENYVCGSRISIGQCHSRGWVLGFPLNCERIHWKYLFLLVLSAIPGAVRAAGLEKWEYLVALCKGTRPSF